MIKLEKLPEPDILKDNAAAWLASLKATIADDKKPTEHQKSRYRHPIIKSVLEKETHGKCAYCESELLHITFGDVEHIIPKSQEIDHIFDWDNLTLACDKCNTYKGASPNLFDPYLDDPDVSFIFAGPMISAKPNSDKAKYTELTLQLNRTELMEKRRDRLKSVGSIILLISKADNVDLRQALIDDLRDNEFSSETEYSAFVRSFGNLMLDEIL